MFVTTAVRDGIGTMTLNNPPLNILTRQVFKEIEDVFESFIHDGRVRAIVLTATRQERKGNLYFSSGADLKMLRDFSAGPPEATRKFFDELMALGLRLERSSKPLIAVVDGICYGGALELVLCCDILIAGPHAVFSFKEIKRRIFPGFGGTQRAARRMYQHRGAKSFKQAVQLVVSGRDVSAVDAGKIGLIDVYDVTPESGLTVQLARITRDPSAFLRPESTGIQTDLLDRVTLAELGKGHSKQAVDLAHLAMVHGNRLPLPKGLEVERDCFLECFGSQEARSALTDFGQGGQAQFPPESVY